MCKESPRAVPKRKQKLQKKKKKKPRQSRQLKTKQKKVQRRKKLFQRFLQMVEEFSLLLWPKA